MRLNDSFVVRHISYTFQFYSPPILLCPDVKAPSAARWHSYQHCPVCLPCLTTGIVARQRCSRYQIWGLSPGRISVSVTRLQGNRGTTERDAHTQAWRGATLSQQWEKAAAYKWILYQARIIMYQDRIQIFTA